MRNPCGSRRSRTYSAKIPHPLDETESYMDLQRANKSKHGGGHCGAGRETSSLHLPAAQAPKPQQAKARESFERHEITVAHAELLARLDPKQQLTALAEACYFQRTLLMAGTFKPEKCLPEPAPLGELNAWIERNTKVDPGSPDTPQYFPELADAFEEPDTLLQLSASDMPGALLQDKKHGLVGTRRWVPVKGKACEYSRKGVIVHGGPLTILDVCISKKCGKHHPKVKKSCRQCGSRPAGRKCPARGEMESTNRACAAGTDPATRRSVVQ